MYICICVCVLLEENMVKLYAAIQRDMFADFRCLQNSVDGKLESHNLRGCSICTFAHSTIYLSFIYIVVCVTLEYKVFLLWLQFHSISFSCLQLLWPLKNK